MTDTGSSSPEAAAAGCPAHAGAVRLSGLEYQQTPSQLYRTLRREHGAVAPVLLDGDVPAWLVPVAPPVTGRGQCMRRECPR